MDSENEFVSLSVRPRVRDRVRAMKQGGETYNDVIIRLLARAETDSETRNEHQ